MRGYLVEPKWYERMIGARICLSWAGTGLDVGGYDTDSEDFSSCSDDESVAESTKAANSDKYDK